MNAPKLYDDKQTMRFGNGQQHLITGLRELIDDLPEGPLEIVEVGSFQGESAIIWMMSPKVKKLYCVDSWCAYPEWNNAEAFAKIESLFDENIAGYGDRIVKLKGKSVDISRTFNKESVNVVYIDASHDYNSVRNDLAAWMPIIVTGGYVCGHDWHNINIVRAVHDYWSMPDKCYQDFSWIKKIERKGQE